PLEMRHRSVGKRWNNCGGAQNYIFNAQNCGVDCHAPQVCDQASFLLYSVPTSHNLSISSLRRWIMTEIYDWQAAVFEFFDLANVSVSDQKQLLETRYSAEIVKKAV